MDPRRLSTSDVMAMGITETPVPVTDIPDDRDGVTWYVDPFDEENPDIAESLEAGKVIDCPEYYGIPYVWKDEAGYHGRLLQYRAVSESHDWPDADSCIEWFTDTAYAVAG